jgi:cyclic pyranopterin monophosphate synthase
MSDLTHFDAAGNAVMVDVGGKEVSLRTATASGRVLMEAQTLALIERRGWPGSWAPSARPS